MSETKSVKDRSGCKDKSSSGRQKHVVNLSSLRSETFTPGAADVTSKCPAVFIKTFGCQMNVRDSEIICGLLKAKSYELTDSPDEADVILLNTCSVRQHAEDRVWSQIIGYKNKGRIIGLVGCMAEYHKSDAFKKAPNLDFVCGPNNIAAIPFLIEQAKNSKGKGLAVGQKQRDEFIYNTNFQAKKDKSFVVIAEGCNNFCSYCVVPLVRGMERSRHYQDILEEIKKLVEKGVNDITLLGQNVNSYISHPSTSLASVPSALIVSTSARGGTPYGRSTESTKVTFVDLLKMVNDIEGLESFSFLTSHPKDASKELFEIMLKLDKIKKILHLPLQSGSDRILKLMNRGYTKKEFLDKVKSYKDIVNGAISSDIIIGFPTETEKDFLETKNIIQDLKFDAAYIFKYSVRPHTAAAKWADDVPLKEKQRRHKILLDLQRKISKSKK